MHPWGVAETVAGRGPTVGLRLRTSVSEVNFPDWHQDEWGMVRVAGPSGSGWWSRCHQSSPMGWLRFGGELSRRPLPGRLLVVSRWVGFWLRIFFQLLQEQQLALGTHAVRGDFQV